ncbi:MAG: glycosyltransferase [Flavisolibacter sp.]
MRVCCVIVTYGDRWQLVEKVVKEAFHQGVNRLVLIDNGSWEKSRNMIKQLSSRYAESLVLHRFDCNEGSARAFKYGLKTARQLDCEYIWLLDDDNLPEAHALDALKDFWTKNERRKDGLFALSSLRSDRLVFRQALQTRKADALLWPKNSFLGFHLRQVSSKIRERIFPVQSEQTLERTALKIDAAFYGGLFIHREILDKIGYPDEDLVLYSDDFCFTYPITLKQGEIWLVPESAVKDIDTPFYLPVKKGFLYHSSLDAENDVQIYYATRNSVYCTRKYFITNRLTYFMNKMVFLLLITGIGMLRGKFKRLKLIFEAIHDGEQQQLGRNPKYKLK